MTKFLNNFDENLFKSSLNKEDLIEAKKEWLNFREEKCIEKKTCICKHKIQNVRYYINKNNGNIICCGIVCCNKFNMEQREMDNKTLEKILKLKNPTVLPEAKIKFFPVRYRALINPSEKKPK